MANKKKKTKQAQAAKPGPPAIERFKRSLPGVAAALAAGLAVAFAFPDFGVWPLAWVAFVPLLFVLEGAGPGRAFRLGLLAGATANLVGFFWIVDLLTVFGHLPFWLAVIITLGGTVYQGLSIGAAFAGAVFVNRRRGYSLIWTLPLFYTAFEAFVPILFPWYLGNCQYTLLWLVQVCDIFGISAVTFLVISGNCVIWVVVRNLKTDVKKSLVTAGIAFAVLGLVCVYGVVRVSQVERQEQEALRLKVAVVEPEIGIFEQQRTEFPEGTPPLWILKWNNLQLHKTSVELEKKYAPDLILWPESTFFPAISTWGRRHPAQWLELSDKARFLRLEHGAFTEAPTWAPPFKATAVHARTAARGYLVGEGCSVARLADGELTLENPGCGKTLRSVWTGCSDEAQVEDSDVDGCITYVAGDGGIILARDNTGTWVQLRVEDETDFLAVAGFDPERFVAAGSGRVLFGHLHEGPGNVLETPGVTWVKALRKGPDIVLVSRTGRLLELASRGELPRYERGDGPFEGQHEGTGVSDAAVSPGGLVYVAGPGGLYAAGQTRPLIEGDISAVACPGTGACLATGRSGRYLLSQEEVRQIPGSPASGADRLLSFLPQNRFFWWLPYDVTDVLVSDAALPETSSFPEAVVEDDSTHVRDQNAVFRSFSTPLLFGSTSGVLRDHEDPNSLENTRYNSAFVADGAGVISGRYDKQYLLTFGEYMPLGKRFPILYDWVPAAGRFEAGPATAPIAFRNFKLGVLICYEDIIASHTNEVATQGANALFNLTNDAWFGKTKEPMQHFVLALFRTIEQRLPMVRATTTGISGHISATGRIVHITDLHEAETFVTDVPMLEGGTVYSCGGRHAVWLLLATALVLLALAVRRPEPRQDRPADPAGKR